MRGNLEEELCWRILVPVARVAQKSHASWDDLAISYLMGRLFWSDDTDDMEILISDLKLLREDPKSPWLNLPWNLPLENESRA